MSVLTADRDDDAWQAWRAAGVTATDVADAAAGTYGGAYAVVARKLGLVPPDPENDAMRRGHRWQPAVADAVHALTGWWVVGEEAWCEHPGDGRWRATVDGFLADAPEATPDQLAGILEVKTRGAHVRPDRDRWGHQVQWQLLVTGLRSAVLAEAVIDDTDDTCTGLRLHRIDADPFHQDLLTGLAVELWGHIADRTLPSPTAGALPLVKAVHGTADPDAEPVDLSGLADDLARFADIKAAVKAVTDERDALEARIREAVGDATSGTCDGWTVKVSAPTLTLTRDAEARLLAERPDLGRVVLDRDLAKQVAPDLYEQHRTRAGARRLTVTPRRDTP